jgi:predicted ATPase
MLLTRAQITNFRSVEDSGVFDIDNLTCLVGKNEAGKTAILQALHVLRPQNSAKTRLEVTEDYPRRFVTKYDERHSGNEARVAKTWWKISAEARQALIDEFGVDAVTDHDLSIEKYYNSKNSIWSPPIDEQKALRHLIDQSHFNASERSAVARATTTAQLVAAIDAVADKTAKHTSLLQRLKAYRDASVLSKAVDILSPFVPYFFYTSHFDRMSGQIAVEKLAEQEAAGTLGVDDRIFLDFLNLAGTSISELSDAKRYEELKARCEAASNEITEQIFKYWSQNESLEVQLDFSQGRAGDPKPFNSGTIIRARVWNALHRASVPFSERSAGFVWFFSFLVQFAALKRTAGKTLILLDEPGLTLHGRAQADLLKYIENELLPYHQVIFTTHSPFMIPAERFTSVRIVEDVVRRPTTGRPTVEGTKVRADVLVTDRGTMFPLQAALGYDISQSLFIGKHTLVVEGPSDILYLQALSEVLRRLGRESLDPRWTMCPSGGIGNIQPFVSLFGGNQLNVAVLADSSKKDKSRLEALRRSEILRAGHLITVGDIVGVDDADIEDLFGDNGYIKIVNAAYGLAPAVALTASQLPVVDTARVAKRVEAAFRTMPPNAAAYDHFAPAAWLIRNVDVLSEPIFKDALAKAEKAFAEINAMLV